MWKIIGCCFSAGIGLDRAEISATPSELAMFLTLLIREAYGLGGPEKMAELDMVSEAVVDLVKDPDADRFWGHLPILADDTEYFNTAEFLQMVCGEKKHMSLSSMVGFKCELAELFKDVTCPFADSFRGLATKGLGSTLTFKWIYKKV